jgi:hypothetical protein
VTVHRRDGDTGDGCDHNEEEEHGDDPATPDRAV